jgi:acyl carrier protein
MANLDKTNEQRIQEAIVRALRISGPHPTTPLRMGSTPGWDSMGHMTVVMELEKEFNVRFPPYRLPELIDIPSIAKTLEGAPQPQGGSH